MTNLNKKNKKSKSDNSPRVGLTEFLQKNFDLRFNEICKTVEFRPKGKDYFEVMDDEVFLTLLDNCRECTGFEFKRTLLDELLGSFNVVTKYNPLKEYFKTLPITSNDTPFSEWLDHIVLCNELDRVSLLDFIKRWAVSAVRSVFDKFYVPKQMLLLRSTGESRGKSSFLFDSLTPKKLSRYRKSDPCLQNIKDAEIELATFFLISIDEFDLWLNYPENRRRAKSYLSKQQINVRLPHGKRTRELTRIASFIGTCNGLEFLNQESGFSRYIVINAEAIKNKAFYEENNLVPPSKTAEDFNADLFWARAYTLFVDGFDSNIEGKTLACLLNQNKLFGISDEVVELIQLFLSPSFEGEENAIFMSASEIKSYLNRVQEDVEVYSIVKLGKVLIQLNFKKTVGKKNNCSYSSYGYWVKKNNLSQTTQKDNLNWGALTPPSAKKLTFVTES